MLRNRFYDMLLDVARFEGMSMTKVYQLLQEAVYAAQQDQDPIVQARWQKIPHDGDAVTVEEFFAYLDQSKSNLGKQSMDCWWNIKGMGIGPLSETQLTVVQLPPGEKHN